MGTVFTLAYKRQVTELRRIDGTLVSVPGQSARDSPPTSHLPLVHTARCITGSFVKHVSGFLKISADRIHGDCLSQLTQQCASV